MPKRRRDNAHDDDSPNDSSHLPHELSRETKRQRRHLTSVIEDGSKQLFHAMRFARGFERQKLGRRQKSAHKKPDPAKEAERLEGEVAALKRIPLAELAEAYLCRQLLRAQNVAEHEALPRFVVYKAGAEQPRDAAYVNVTSRLYKSAPITKCLDRVLRDVRGVLGMRSSELAPKKKRKRKADYEAEAGEGEKDGEPELSKSLVNGDLTMESGNRDARGAGDSEESEGDDFHGFEDEDEEPLANGQDYDSADDDVYGSGQHDARLASSDENYDDDDDDDEMEEDESGNPALSNGLELPVGLRSEDIAMAAESGTDYSDEEEDEPLPRRVATGSKVTTSTSSFLPSLNTGYISGSDSDASSDVSALAPPRKNRMGQRARQALWEKKFGEKARHIRRGDPSVRDRDRDQGWDLKRGAQESGGRGGGRGGRGGRDSRNGRGDWRGQTDRSAARARGSGLDGAERKPRGSGRRGGEAAQKVPTYGSAHPSWVARKAAKDKESAATRPSGKKITFD